MSRQAEEMEKRYREDKEQDHIYRRAEKEADRQATVEAVTAVLEMKRGKQTRAFIRKVVTGTVTALITSFCCYSIAWLIHISVEAWQGGLSPGDWFRWGKTWYGEILAPIVWWVLGWFA